MYSALYIGIGICILAVIGAIILLRPSGRTVYLDEDMMCPPPGSLENKSMWAQRWVGEKIRWMDDTGQLAEYPIVRTYMPGKDGHFIEVYGERNGEEILLFAHFGCPSVEFSNGSTIAFDRVNKSDRLRGVE